MSEKKFVTYEQFGAKGDGVADDFSAIKLAHDYANENGLPVVAADNAHYYIHDPRVNGEVSVIKIKTDVDWGNAKFTIDDRDVSTMSFDDTYPWHNKAVFHICSDYEMVRIDDKETLDAILAQGLNTKSKRVALKFDYPVMIMPYSNAECGGIYRRRGYSAWRGAAAHEVILLDEDGNISEETPVMWDYDTLDYVEVYRVDDKPITVKGGEFITRSSGVNTYIYEANGKRKRYGGYIMRGLLISRSNSLLQNVKHYVTDEMPISVQVKDGQIDFVPSCYRGFFLVSKANHVTIEGCVLTGRRCYRRHTGGTGGTYDFSANSVNLIVLKDCVQSNFWVRIDENFNISAAKEGDPDALPSMTIVEYQGVNLKMHWGIGGTNYCKNIHYINSTLSRFDAHQGMYNGLVKGCTINCLALTGKGEFVVEDTRWLAVGKYPGGNSLICLREDYGSTWEGNVIAKNVKAYVFTGAPAYIAQHRFTNWYFGYDSCFPNLEVDGIEVYNIETGELLPEGSDIYVTTKSVVTEPALHLKNTVNTPPVWPDVDEDGDGLVDGTNIPFDDVVDKKGIVDTESRTNVNPITAPEYVKIINNKCGYNYVVADMSDVEGAEGGFFAKTKFITDDAEYVGTKHPEAKVFSFRKLEESDFS